MSFWKVVKSREFRIISLVIIITIIGLIALASTSKAYENGYSDLKKQLVSIAIGAIALAIVATIDYEVYLKYWYVFYCGSIILLILVLFTDPINNARSWFVISKINYAIQPSEFSKIIIIITLARLLSNLKKTGMSDRERAIKVLNLVAIMAVPIILIIRQPDFGTAMVFVISILSMLFVWGIDVKIIKLGLISLIAVIPTVYFFLLKPGQKERIKVFLNPMRDPMGSGYHVLQSKIAIGSGQFTGMGLFNGNQTQMGYLFAKTTDFIFASIAEEMGFIVSSFVIILLVLLIIDCFNVAHTARDEEGKLMVVGFGMMLAFHMVVNVGMTMGLVPVTGIPLPFISYGGSAMLTNMIVIGMILGVSFRKRGLRF